jgi:hypothetical protein
MCEEWQRRGFANTPLAIYHGVDFRVATHVQVPDEPYTTFLQEGPHDARGARGGGPAEQQRDRRDPPGAGGAQMSWRPEVPADFAGEGNKIKWRAVPYVRGLGLDIGCGPWKVFPHSIGLDGAPSWSRDNRGPNLVMDCTSIEVFADGCSTTSSARTSSSTSRIPRRC